MERAQKRDAARKARFWFRRQIYPVGEERPRDPSYEVDLPTPPSETVEKDDDLAIRPRHKGDCGRCRIHNAFLNEGPAQRPVTEEYEEMTLDEIINGKVSSHLRRCRQLIKYLLVSHRVQTSQVSSEL
jgi:glutamate--cysteine ligase catalytic subunit